jgi:hypothetical protein
MTRGKCAEVIGRLLRTFACAFAVTAWCDPEKDAARTYCNNSLRETMMNHNVTYDAKWRAYHSCMDVQNRRMLHGATRPGDSP